MNKEEEYVDEVDDVDNVEPQKASNKSTIVMIIIFVIIVAGFFGLLFSKPNQTKVHSDTQIATAREKSTASIVSLGMTPKIPIIKAGEKFGFKITREVNFTGNMTDVKLSFQIPEDVKDRQKISDLKINPKPSKIVKKEDGTFATIEFKNPTGRKEITIEGTAQVRTYNFAIAEKINKNIDGKLTQEQTDRYLREETGIDTKSRLIKNICRDEIQTATNDVDTVKNIFDYVVENLRYNINDINKNKGALRAIQSGNGVCEEFADLFVTLCRVKGIPARVVEGFDIPFTDNDKEIYSGHAWCEVYFPQYGWVTYDPTNSLNRELKKKMKEIKITPYDMLSELIKYKSYVILNANTVSIIYEGKGNITSRNLGISYKKL